MFFGVKMLLPPIIAAHDTLSPLCLPSASGCHGEYRARHPQQPSCLDTPPTQRTMFVSATLTRCHSLLSVNDKFSPGLRVLFSPAPLFFDSFTHIFSVSRCLGVHSGRCGSRAPDLEDE